MTIEQIKEMVAGEEYDFLRTNPHLKDRIMFLTLGGSYAYGTNIETSDVDVRGCAMNSKSDKYSAMTLLENRATLSTEVSEEVETIEELYHVNFTSVIVQDIDFSDAFEASVEAKMTAEQDALRAEQEKKTAVVKAEQEAEVAAIEAEAAIARAEGEAEAMRITREALQNMPDAYIQQMWIEKWNGEIPVVQAGDSASVIVNPGLKDAGQ